MKQFSPETIQALKFYVYALVDPEKLKSDPRRIFYVGKGIGNRCFSHAREEIGVQRVLGEPNPKMDQIHKIRKRTGAAPQIEIIVHGLAEPEAHRIEAALISTLQTDCNLVGGKYAVDFDLTPAQVEGKHSHPIKETDLKACVLLVSLNGGADLAPFPEIAEQDLPGRTLRYWVLASKAADRIDYVAGVYNQLIRCVFKVRKRSDGRAQYQRHDLGLNKGGHPRIKTEFKGDRCLEKEEQWCNRRVVNAAGETLSKFRWGVGTNLIGQTSN